MAKYCINLLSKRLHLNYYLYFYFDYFKVVAKLSKIYPKDTEAPPGGVDDMTKLSYLHEPGVLQNLKIRYELNEIYVRFSSFNVIRFSKVYQWKRLLSIFLIAITDIYWKYSDCNKSIPKTTSYLWCAHDATIQGSTIWRIKPSCICSC